MNRENRGSYSETPDEDRRRTAIHEAGHAVVALAFGIGVARLTIVHDPDRGRKGSFACDESQLKGHREQAMVAIAGVLAEVQVYSNYHEGGARQDWGDYLGTVDWLTAGRSDEEFQALSSELKLEARRVLIEHWRAVETLAQALLTHGELAAEHVRASFAEATRA